MHLKFVKFFWRSEVSEKLVRKWHKAILFKERFFFYIDFNNSEKISALGWKSSGIFWHMVVLPLFDKWLSRMESQHQVEPSSCRTWFIDRIHWPFFFFPLYFNSFSLRSGFKKTQNFLTTALDLFNLFNRNKTHSIKVFLLTAECHCHICPSRHF